MAFISVRKRHYNGYEEDYFLDAKHDGWTPLPEYARRFLTSAEALSFLSTNFTKLNSSYGAVGQPMVVERVFKYGKIWY